MRGREPKGHNSEDRQQGAEGLSLRLDGRSLARLYSLLRGRFGFRNWWPAGSVFEVVVGAVLTQQTTWTNVEKAIANLKKDNALSLDAIAGMRRRRLEAAIRPSGYFRQKAARLREFCRLIREKHGSLDGMLALGPEELREALMSANGIGKETCDSIMLYAAGKPVFVIDAYTKRIVTRVFGLADEPDYDALQAAFQNAMKPDITLYKDMHAQLVELAKRHCRKRDPLCASCPALAMCAYGKGHAR